MSMCVLLLLAVGQSGQVESKDFSKEAQAAALRATVKVVNLTNNRDASAVIIKQEPKFVYFLTAAHVAHAGDKLEIQTFTAESYPDAAETYKSAEVIAADKERDVAVLRLATTDTMPGTLPLCPPKKVQNDKDFAALSTGCGGGRRRCARLKRCAAKSRCSARRQRYDAGVGDCRGPGEWALGRTAGGQARPRHRHRQRRQRQPGILRPH